ncbi:glycosyltransferase family 2 protein [Candidatus Uhrbacteria bacterium]|nr:glycosyltransferase family 2 protein [Candidatus Uhrbacteria bacterium]
MKVIAVMPAYQEKTRIIAAISGIQPYVSQIVVVVDGSEDGTFDEAKKTSAMVLHHAINRGQGAALKTGTEAAIKLGADVIVHIDADGQQDPQAISKLIEPIKEGKADVVFGSRFLGVDPEGMPAVRRAVLILGKLFSHFILGIPRQMTDPQSGLRAMTADAARRIDFKQDRMAHCSEILRLVTRSDLRWMEVPVRVSYTKDTLAKGNQTSDAFRIVWHLLLGMFQ